MLDELCSRHIADVREGDPVAERGHPVRTAAGISAGQRRMRLGFWLGLLRAQFIHWCILIVLGYSSSASSFFGQFQLFGQQLRLLRGSSRSLAHSVIFVEDHVAALAGLQVDDPGEEADFVVGVQVLPQAVGEVADGAGAGEAERLPPSKLGDGIAVVLVGADEVAFTGHGLGVVEEIALDALAVAVGRLEDAHLVAAICVHHSGDAGV